ncbi:MAG: NAD-dependent epimerase/dehydratase family protein [Nitrospirae bacterium]|nr:NAD-dependent epimerase/dehydratase family protein [Nitrospirota bacterium]
MVEDFYRDKRLLVTGASGFLASNLVEALRDTKCFIRRLSRGPRFSAVSGAASVEDMTGDIKDATVWEHALKDIDLVFHFAAQTSAYEAGNAPAADLAVNVLPVIHMLETCRKRDLRPAVLMAGTVTEAGIAQKLPVDEDLPDRPVTVYDIHKLTAELYLKYYVIQGAVRGTALRLANVYGPGPGRSGAGRGVLNSMIRKALSGETLTIYGHGNYIRDYVYIKDVVGAFLAAGAGMDRLSGRHFVIGAGKGHTVAGAVNMVARHVEKRCGRAVPVRFVDPPRSLSPIERRNFIADTTGFSTATGWTANTSLADGIDLTIDYFSRS